MKGVEQRYLFYAVFTLESLPKVGTLLPQTMYATTRILDELVDTTGGKTLRVEDDCKLYQEDGH